MTFTDRLHQETQAIWQASLNHPFIQGLAAGTLPVSTFRYYLIQDTQYLRAFSHLHELVAERLPQADGERLLKLAASAGEDTHRNEILADLNLTSEEIAASEMAPNNYSYITHMEHQLLVSTPASVTGLVPCYWLYAEIAQNWQGQTSPNPIYQKFFDGYAGSDFTTSTKALLELVNQLAEISSLEEQEQMRTAFMRSSQFELAFWQMAYTNQTWADLGKR